MPVGIECKSYANMAFYKWYDQAVINTPKDCEPIVVAKANYRRPVVIVDAEANLGEGEVFDMLHGLYARIEELERQRDEARARAAAAYEDAAILAQAGPDLPDRSHLRQKDFAKLSTEIRALASDPERDALAERDKRIRAEEREACADAVSEWLKEYPWHRGLLEDIQELATDPERDALAERDKRIRAEEREACAKVAEKWDNYANPEKSRLIRDCGIRNALSDTIAAAIRARSED